MGGRRRDSCHRVLQVLAGGLDSSLQRSRMRFRIWCDRYRKLARSATVLSEVRSCSCQVLVEREVRQLGLHERNSKFRVRDLELGD